MMVSERRFLWAALVFLRRNKQLINLEKYKKFCDDSLYTLFKIINADKIECLTLERNCGVGTETSKITNFPIAENDISKMIDLEIRNETPVNFLINTDLIDEYINIKNDYEKNIGSLLNRVPINKCGI